MTINLNSCGKNSFFFFYWYNKRTRRVVNTFLFSKNDINDVVWCNVECNVSQHWRSSKSVPVLCESEITWDYLTKAKGHAVTFLPPPSLSPSCLLFLTLTFFFQRSLKNQDAIFRELPQNQPHSEVSLFMKHTPGKDGSCGWRITKATGDGNYCVQVQILCSFRCISDLWRKRAWFNNNKTNSSVSAWCCSWRWFMAT